MSDWEELWSVQTGDLNSGSIPKKVTYYLTKASFIRDRRKVVRSFHVLERVYADEEKIWSYPQNIEDLLKIEEENLEKWQENNTEIEMIISQSKYYIDTIDSLDSDSNNFAAVIAKKRWKKLSRRRPTDLKELEKRLWNK